MTRVPVSDLLPVLIGVNPRLSIELHGEVFFGVVEADVLDHGADSTPTREQFPKIFPQNPHDLTFSA